MTDWRTAMNWRSELEAIVEAVPGDQLCHLIGELARLDAVTRQRLVQPENGAEAYLTAAEVSDMLKVDRRWPYRHADKLGAIHLSDRCVRFPLSRIEHYIADHR